MCIATYMLVKGAPMNKPAHMKDRCIGFAVRSASRHLVQKYDDALKPAKLTSGQFAVLAALSSVGRAPLGLLATGLHMDRTTLTKYVRTLVKRELIDVQPHPEDARSKVLSLTDLGRKKFADAMPFWEEAQTSALKRLREDGLSEDGLALFKKQLALLAED
ncbi:MAG: MarR family transcriptional regulator [Hyphomicrobiales bacterium]|nr:MAG: MarR family transcriptional regulator [Hyphomicrobiales bacterium]